MDTILLLEDEDTLRRSMARGLAKLHDVEILEAATVAEARAFLEHRRPRLAISDFDLPDGTGLELVAALEKNGLRVPIVFISAYVAKFRSRLPPTGDFEVYEKPLALDRLRAIVEDKLVGEPPPSPFSVTDYVQLAGMGGHTVAIEVTSVAGRGRIVVRSGQVWTAQDERGTGLEAFRRLAFLAAPAIRVRTLEGDDPGPRDIRGSAEAVLLEAARQHDERGRDEPPEVQNAALPSVLPSVRPPPRPSSRPTTTPPQIARRPITIPSPPQAPRETLLSAQPLSTGAKFRFEELFDRGVDALLKKDYRAAYLCFAEASEIDPNDGRVRANLKRLAALGFG
jgi:CheY-like chemotaxis protein